MPLHNQSSFFGLSKIQTATFIALLFHIIGFVGVIFFNNPFFVKTTSINLLLMFVLLLYTHPDKNKSFYILITICFIVGITVELIGTKTGWLFGNYSYGKVLGPCVSGVPLIIGVNWFVVIYCCGITMTTLLSKLTSMVSPEMSTSPKLKVASLVFDGASLAVFFDWIMEPVAVRLGYWKWGGSGEIPLYNYVCWFAVSIGLLFLFNRLGFDKQNKFAVNLLLIQAMFFLLLRTFL